MKLYYLFFASLLWLMILPSDSAAYTCRITLGAFVALENSSQTFNGQTNNDSAVFSTRFFLKESELTSARLEFVGDLRNKYDFFGNVNPQLLQLTGQNVLQPRQLSLRTNPSQLGVGWAIGRVPVPQAGLVTVDGAEVIYRLNPSLKLAFFGGLDPKRPDQYSMQFNSDSAVAGVYSFYQQSPDSSGNNLSSSNAFVNRAQIGNKNQAYLFDNTSYRWSDSDQISILTYLAMIPSVRLQTLYLSWTEEWSKSVTSTFNFTSIDVQEYTLRQGFLNTLAPSPYEEINLQLRQSLSQRSLMIYSASWGFRLSDRFSYQEISTGPSFSQLLGSNFALQTSLGARKNFTANQVFFRGNLSYFSRKMEITLMEEFGYSYEADKNTYHPNITDAGVAYYFSRQFLTSVNLQMASNESVSVFAGYLTIGLRLGNDGVAPLHAQPTPVVGSLIYGANQGNL